MTYGQARFPRSAYARRASSLADDLTSWADTYHRIVDAGTQNGASPATVKAADDRRYFLEDLAHRMNAIAVDIALMS